MNIYYKNKFDNYTLIIFFILFFCSSNTGFAAARNPQIPTLDELSGNWQKSEEILCLPSISNFYGALQADRNLLSISHLTFPPLSLGGSSNTENPMWWAWGPYESTAALTIDGQKINAEELRWYAYQILRKKRLANLDINTIVRMSFEENAVLFKVIIKNISSRNQQPEIKIDLNGAVRKYDKDWAFSFPRPFGKHEFERNIIEKNKGILFKDTKSTACAAFAFATAANKINPGEGGANSIWKKEDPENKYSSDAIWNLNLKPGETKEIEIALFSGTDPVSVRESCIARINNFDKYFNDAKTKWQGRFDDAFQPGNDHYSGHLPILKTEDEKIKRQYYLSIAGFLAMERNNFEKFKRVFVTVAPRNAVTVTYFWDMSMSSKLWSLLDPVSMRDQLRFFLGKDIHKCYAIDHIEYKPVGPWYAANDMTIFTLLYTYLSVTGDKDFLKVDCEGKSVLNRLDDIASFWKTLRPLNSALADYGTADNLLECVPTYTHKVPSFNASNVWIMREYAKILEYHGEKTKAAEYREDANNLAKEILNLYVQGKGYWACLNNDNKKTEVRHCIDFFVIADCMQEDLSMTQKKEMILFAESELLTPTWMRALSLADSAAGKSDRADHGPKGAYDAWPSFTMNAFTRLGYYDKALAFLKRTEKVTREGPYGQAHRITKSLIAKKAGDEKEGQEYNAVTSGNIADVIIGTFFGFSPDYTGINIIREANIARGFEGTLENIKWNSGLYTIQSTSTGLKFSKQ